MRVLIVGGGGREHALAWKLRQSPHCERLWCAPGNAGIAALAECLPLGAEDVEGITAWAVAERPDLVVVGPEAPLVAGVADRLRAAGMLVFGPSAAAAVIEGSKVFARDLMTRTGVPQPRYARCRDFDAAGQVLDAWESEGIIQAVVKADGLAAGKGAVVCDSIAAARDTAREMLVDRVFGAAGSEVVIEERLSGEEASLLAITDGRNVVPLLPAQDYKRALDGDQGLNTGGMGAYAPAPVLAGALAEQAVETIVRPVLRGLEEAGRRFQGCLYAGLMRSGGELRVIEFNCRLGDPETQVVLPLLESDLLELLAAAAAGDLGGHEARWSGQHAVSVVMASGGYPGRYETGKPIQGVAEAGALPGVTVFHAGTRLQDGEPVTAGGRVLNVTAVGADFAEARRNAYAAVDRIQFEGAHFRTDVAARVA